MTKTEMLKAAQQDGDATTKLVAALRGADEDTMLNLIERLIAATRADTVDDVMIDLKRDGYAEAADYLKVNY